MLDSLRRNSYIVVVIITTSSANQSACELCSSRPADHLVRNEAARRSGSACSTRRNRRRVDAGYWRVAAMAARLDAAGFTAERTAGRLVCEGCWARILAVLNK